MALYPLKFTPILKSKIWGGTKLHTKFNRPIAGLDNIGESWEVSGVEGDVSLAENGFLKGNSLNELVEVYMGDLVGEKIYEQYGNDFPLLVKLIDATDNLSIQVHPGDELAAERHDSFGKTEMWYILDADPDAFLISGFTYPITKEEYLAQVENDTLEASLQKFSVKRGDVFFIPAGTVHAIGRGCVIAEIQQTSDITYRIYDYNRVDSEGNRRELHTELAVDAIAFDSWKSEKIVPRAVENDLVQVVSCPYFTTNILAIDRAHELDFAAIDSFVLLTVVEGSVRCQYDEGEETLKTGETLLVPAEMYALRLIPEGNAKLLEVYIEETDEVEA